MDRILVLDLDDTLVDRAAVVHAWADEVADAHGDPRLRDWLVELDRDGDRVRERADFLTRAASRLGWQASVTELLEQWPRAFGARYRLEDAVRDALVRTRTAGHRIAVVTNGDVARQGAKIDAMGLADLVDACVISGEAGCRKPDPRIFALAADRAGADLTRASG